MAGLFGLTLLCNAALLFVVQPMVGKMLLPVFGGAPAVWNTCQVFFQTALLAGYAYAHGVATRLPARGQVVFHAVALTAALLFSPLALASVAPPDASQAAWLFGKLLVAVGAPLVVLSAAAPLLQRWFAATGRARAADPYFLYVVSNCGSLAGLGLYPLLIEPALDLRDQAQAWTLGFLIVFALSVLCGVVAWRSHAAHENAAPALVDRETPLSRRLHWLSLSAIPASLTLGVTTHVTTDLAAVPLLWVVPLGLYLSTFMLAFSHRGLSWCMLARRALPPVALVLGPLLVTRPPVPPAWILLGHLLLFGVACLACHGELARTRPPPEQLTGYYLHLAVGGAAGGTFNTFAAPLIFTTIVEYPLMVVAAAALAIPRPAGVGAALRARILDIAVPTLLAFGILLTLLGLHAARIALPTWANSLLYVAAALSALTCRRRPLRFGAVFALAIVLAGGLVGVRGGELLHCERNFFGVKSVILRDGGRVVALVHGDTNHGAQLYRATGPQEPMTYYDRAGPIGDIFSTFSGAAAASRVAVVGLGIGALVSYGQPGQHFTFFEIDPAVERLARDARYFTLLRDARCDWSIEVGDGRRLLSSGAPWARRAAGVSAGDPADDAPVGGSRPPFGMIVLDAFSSDAVPTHLLTREALETCLSRLDDHGVLVMNVTNRFVRLEPMLAALALDLGLTCVTRHDDPLPLARRAAGALPSQFIVMARTPRDLRDLPFKPGWRPAATKPGVRGWTDRRSSLTSVLAW